MSSLSLKHIYKVYTGGVRAVNDFNLEIKDKSFVVLVGPSGCGKSTTLRMIAGLENITSGQLYIDDTIVNDVESKNRDIAMVFQSYALYPHMTVYQNMAFGLKLRHINSSIIDQKVRQAAEILEITELLDRKPKELSGGQRQRVALGRAIVREPNVFLLDEPLSNLDAKLRVQMRTEITKLHEKLQTTFIYVTHDQTEAMTMGDVIVVMKNGFIQQADTPITLYEDPTNLFVATFLGSPQMNIIETRLVNEKGSYTAILGSSETNKIILSKETSKNLVSKKLDETKTYLFGVRPDYITLSENGIPALVEVVEQLGDETLLYTKIEGHDKYVIVKLPLTGSIKVGQTVHLNINLDKVCLFDKEAELSIIGVPLMNFLPSTYSNGVITIGENKISVTNDFTSHILDCASDEDIAFGIKPGDISLHEDIDSLSMKVKIDFIEKRTQYNAIFAKIPGIEEYLVFRAPLDEEVKAGDDVTIYFSEESVGLYDKDGNAIKSREEIFRNTTTAEVKNLTNGKTQISISGGEKLVYSTEDMAAEGFNLDDGNYELTISQDLINICFDRKMSKHLGINYERPVKGHTLAVSCYDEEPVGKKNIIFGQIKGFNEYITITADNNFSVYKMPKFKINVPIKALKFNKI